MRFSQHVSRWAVGLLLLGSVSLSYGWNKPTHMAIGAMAYRELQMTAPQTLARVVSLLRSHPDYQQRWAGKLADSTLSADERDQYLLMLAARWPDDVKEKNNPHDHPTWHYINYVYNPARGMARTDSVLPADGNVLQAFAINREILRSNAPDSSKAIALCWIFHLAGDVQQPLHTVALISDQFPEGDQGGNRFKIKVTPEGKTINLHSFWDGMLLGSDDFRSVSKLAIQLRHDYPRDQANIPEKPDVEAWSLQSFKLAQDIAYRNGHLIAGTGDNGIPLPADYVQTVKPIAEQQVALAGYRLAATLKNDLDN